MATSSCHPSGSGRPGLEIGDVFRTHGDAFRSSHSLTLEQARVMRDVASCRTADLGGHVDICDQCGFERPAYNSCRNRHCPKCQGLAQARWLERQVERIVPTNYFHVVFTLPDSLRDLVHHNRRCMFGLLFEASAATLLDLGRDKKRLGALTGFTAVLHTWTRDLRFHPHIHTIVTGGGLRTDTGEWTSRHAGRYLFPVEVLGALFRGKFMAALVRAREKGKLHFVGRCAALASPDVFDAFKDKLYHKNWVVYAKRPFGGAEEVYRYLGRYTHRVGISNRRIQALDENGVRFSTKDGKSVTLTHEEFIRRFLLHALPKGFVKIRHYGLFAAPNLATHLVQAHKALQVQGHMPAPAILRSSSTEWPEHLHRLTGIDITRCPRCGGSTMTPGPTVLPATSARAPPSDDAEP